MNPLISKLFIIRRKERWNSRRKKGPIGLMKRRKEN